ncbi:iron-siderophore ABC transporter substrate-binding protein [Kineococcus radiotolerans]|uniref:Periplasmic binding protein n=1 Tax=Kineococcus radiotolerans (strain ATCC BAA-149 / DSM 14245 / SRS30216) TaxID=266940 RepID=A6WEY3_KINRD|nr:iron-siderophore ABC transporter substrate-binding protein [Kineococcus radiotolerans]ABS05372.1 periplasmic binding protein [Kineococcus radiotolerans SRS30216 = ATCC BAA-149]
MRPSRRALLATVPLAALAAACGSSDDAASPAPASTAGTGGTGGDTFPVTVEHALGSTTVPAAPTRIVCLGWGSQDVVWALGGQPVGVPEITYGGNPDGTLPWWEGHFDAAATTFLPNPDSGEVPFEQITALTPDLILAVYSGITEADYATLSQIAPTVGYPDQPWLTSWQDQTTMVGKALGKSAEAERLVADAEADLAERAAATPSLEGKTFSYVYATEANLSVYLPGDPRVDTLHALGLVDAPGTAALASAQDVFYTEVAKERVRDVDSDLVVGYGTLTRDQLRADPVYATMPAVASDAVAWIDDEQLVTATSATLLSLPWALDRLVPLLDAAARAADAS